MITNCDSESVEFDLISVQVWSVKEEESVGFTFGGDNSVSLHILRLIPH